MDKQIRTVPCPTCKKTVTWDVDNPYKPFCSERCKLIDFGAWADGSYSVSDQNPDLPPDLPKE